MSEDISIEELLTPSEPEDISNLKLPDPSLKCFYEDIDNRVLWLNSDVDESIISLGRYILKWNLEDKGKPVEERKPIKLMLFCYGGDIDSCNHLIDVMLISKTPVYTYNMGVAMSAGLCIFIAGTKRFCLKRSNALIHSGSGSLSGTAQQVFSSSTAYKKTVDNMFDYIAEQSKIPKSTLKRKSKEEWYINSDEQVKLGIADKIIDDIDEIL